MENGKSMLKKIATVFLCIGAIGTPISLLMLLIAPFLKLFAIISGGIFGIFFITGLVCMLVCSKKAGKKKRLVDAGQYVYADIVDIDVNVNLKVKIDNISMNPYFIICKYTGNNGENYIFKSKSLLYNPSALIRGNQLKVYVDLAKPNKYYVDTSEILPDSAILHKFKFDSVSRGEQLKRSGQYVDAVTCGAELVGRIKVNNIVKPMFLKISSAMAEEFKIPTDEKKRMFAGYVVLCRYDAPDGKIHIFASRGQWGEPASDCRRQRVRVYYSGENFKNYHVALEEIV